MSCCSARACCPRPCSTSCCNPCPRPCSTSCCNPCPRPCSTNCCNPCPKPCSTSCCNPCPRPCSTGCPRPCPRPCSTSCCNPCPRPCSTSCCNPCPRPCSRPCSTSCCNPCPRPCSTSCCNPCPRPCSTSCCNPCPRPCSTSCCNPCPRPCSTSCCNPCPRPCSTSCCNPCPRPCSTSCCNPCPRPCSTSCCNPCPRPCSTSCCNPCPRPCSTRCCNPCRRPCSTRCCNPCPRPCSTSCCNPCPRPCSTSCCSPCRRPCSTSCCSPCPKICSMACLKPCATSCCRPCSISCCRPCSRPCSISCCRPCSMISRSRRCGAPCVRKAYSVYGCGGARISTCCTPRSSCCARSSCGGFSCYGGNYDCLQHNDKATMQNLNDRLASFLEKVRSLEASNCHLERMIREHHESKGPIGQRDFSGYWSTIQCLQEQIRDVTTCNASMFLQIDNARLAAEDFKIKYEHEFVMRQSVEADIANLRCLMEKTCLAKADLEMQLSALHDELACLRNNHQADVSALLSQLSGTVCVEVDAAPQQDLTRVLEEVRCHYEGVIDHHRRKQECWFNEKMEQLCKDMACSTECIESSRSQILDLRRTVQCLEIDLQSQISMRGALESSLAETESRYSNMLAGFQNQINALEAELCQVRAGIEQQGRDYAALLNVKSCLEQEIATYRCLMENQDCQTPGGSPWACSTPSVCKSTC